MRIDISQVIKGEILVYRAEERISHSAINPAEEETKVLFDWILYKLQQKIESAVPAKKEYHLHCKTAGNGKTICLIGEKETYVPKYVSGKNFHRVLKDVADIFNGLDKYSSVYSAPTESFVSYLDISMEL